MHSVPMSPTQLLITAAVVLALMLFRMRRMSKARPLKTERLWIVPAVFAIFTVLTFMQAPPNMRDIPWLMGIAAMGAIVGWYRGKMMRITVAPQTHDLSQAASPFALVLLLAVFGLRYGLRYAIGEEANAWGISLSLLADAPMVFAVAMFALQRVEMFIRAERLLAEARAAHTTAPVTSPPGG